MASEPTIAVQFANNLKRCRDDADLSQEELGVRASLHRTEVSQLERGLRVARIDTLVKLAGGLGIAPAALLAGIDWRPGSIQRGGFQVAEGNVTAPFRRPAGRKLSTNRPT